MKNTLDINVECLERIKSDYADQIKSIARRILKDNLSASYDEFNERADSVMEHIFCSLYTTEYPIILLATQHQDAFEESHERLPGMPGVDYCDCTTDMLYYLARKAFEFDVWAAINEMTGV